MSLEGNAECSCNREEIEPNCYPPGVTSGPVCSSRGACVCGQCMCNTLPDPQEPTKVSNVIDSKKIEKCISAVLLKIKRVSKNNLHAKKTSD